MNQRLLDAICLASDYHCNRPVSLEKAWRKGKGDGNSLPYFVHPIKVMELLWKWGIDHTETLVASICHDLMEDTLMTQEKLIQGVGAESAGYVRELTFQCSQNLSADQAAAEKLEYMKSFRKASVQSLVIKIADRLCNVMDFWDSSRSYAHKYFCKATDLFEIFHDRYDEVAQAFGRTVAKNIAKTIARIEDVLIGSGQFLFL